MIAPRKPEFDSVMEWTLDTQPEELTRIVLDPDRMQSWSPSIFMKAELVERGRPDGLGMTVRMHTKGWLPHAFYFIARITELVEHRSMTVEVQGDFEGVARLAIAPLPDVRHCRAEFRWMVDIRQPYIRWFARHLQPIFLWNHRWAMKKLRRMFQDEIYRRRAFSNEIVTRPATFPHNLAIFRDHWTRRSIRQVWEDRTHGG